MKNVIFVICLAAMALVARDIRMRGGIMTTVDDVQVESFGDDMNFMYAYRFSDGIIHLSHSKGVHTVSEYGCNDISTDNGKSWRHAEDSFGINTFEGLDGTKFQIGCWNADRSQTHSITLYRWNDETGKREMVKTCPIELPYSSQFLLHRDVIRLTSGKLLATVYGNIEGQKKYHSFAIESSDDGRTWSYAGAIAYEQEGENTAEGPDETTVFQLRDGRVCAFYRTSGNGFLHQCFSSDEGRTWSKPQIVDLFKGDASPNGRVLADGTIVVISGRPNVYLLVDFSGTGEHYQKMELYHGGGSSYATVLESAPNEILCIYDESCIGGMYCPTPFSRIHASRFKLSRDDSAKEQSDDPLAAKYDKLFRPQTSAPLAEKNELGLTFAYRQREKNPDYPATYEVMSIPERPQPVLRLISHGDNDQAPGSQWASVNSMSDLNNSDKLTMGMEFRLNDMGEARAQLKLGGVVGATLDDSGYLAYVRFYTDKIELLKENTSGSDAPYESIFVPYDIGTGKFCAFSLVADAKDRTARLYREGESEPLAVATMPKAQGVPSVGFGDGDSAIFGAADISYFGWTIE